MKGIVLAGGTGSRLYPSTLAITKQMLPIFDKPMIYYPLSVLMLTGIRDIMIISTPNDLPIYERLLGKGKQFGLNLTYKAQPAPEGLAQAFLIGEDFISESRVAMILGDNFFYGPTLSASLQKGALESQNDCATIFGYQVEDPQQYGVIEFDGSKVTSIVEKPNYPKSNFAQLGLYFYDQNVVELTKKLKPSSRGELEITDLNNIYLEENKLNCIKLGQDFTWFDTGNPSSLLEASVFVKETEQRLDSKIACLEEIAFGLNWIDENQLEKQALIHKNSIYGEYLQNLLNK